MFVPYALMSVLHVGALAVGSDLAPPTKLWLMPLLAIPVVVSARLKPTLAIVLLLAALLFSWLGDGAGALFPSAPELPLMLGFFGLAHIAYIVLFLRVLRRQRMPWWALVYAAWWVAMIVFLGPHTGNLLIAVGAYGLVLAFRLFVPDAMPDWTSPAVMATYTLGQGLIVAGALATLREGKIQR